MFIFDNRGHLTVAVLLDEIDGVVLGKKFHNFAGERQGADKHMIGF